MALSYERLLEEFGWGGGKGRSQKQTIQGCSNGRLRISLRLFWFCGANGVYFSNYTQMLHAFHFDLF